MVTVPSYHNHGDQALLDTVHGRMRGKDFLTNLSKFSRFLDHAAKNIIFFLIVWFRQLELCAMISRTAIIDSELAWTSHHVQ